MVLGPRGRATVLKGEVGAAEQALAPVLVLVLVLGLELILVVNREQSVSGSGT